MKSFRRRLQALQRRLGIDNRLPHRRNISILIGVAPLTDGTIPLPPFGDAAVAVRLDALDGPSVERRAGEGFSEFLDRAYKGPYVDREADPHTVFIVVAEPFDGETESAEDRAQRMQPLIHPDNLRPKIARNHNLSLLMRNLSVSLGRSIISEILGKLFSAGSSGAECFVQEVIGNDPKTPTRASTNSKADKSLKTLAMVADTVGTIPRPTRTLEATYTVRPE